MEHELKLNISGMDCVSCAAKIEMTLKKTVGIKSAVVNFVSATLIVKYEMGEIEPEQIVQIIKKLGFKAAPVEEKGHDMGEDHHDHQKMESEAAIKKLKARFILTLVFGLPVFYLAMAKMLNLPLPPFSNNILAIIQFILATATIASAFNIWTSGFKGLVRLQPNMDSLIFTGTAAAYIYSLVIAYPIILGRGFTGDVYFESAALILMFISLGKYLEVLTRGKTSEAIKKLIGLQPKEAIVVRDGVEVKIPISEVIVGDIIVVKPGGKIPVDGVVAEGYSGVDEKAITGESMPREKKKGDEVIGATINKTGILKIKATRVGKDTMLAQIIKIVEGAITSKAPIQLLADKISYYFVPAIMILAVLVGILWLILGQPLAFALTIFVAILIITCPCALGLATPTAVMMGTGLAAQNGILIKNGEALEKAKKLDVIVFDKTGTITKGEPVVTDVVSVENKKLKMKEDDILQLAASVEKNSEHPLAEAIVNAAQEKKLTLLKSGGFNAIPGKGVEAKINGKLIYFGTRKLMAENKISTSKVETDLIEIEKGGKTAMILAQDTDVIGIIAVADTIKESSQKAIELLHKMKIETVIITGDNERVAQAIAKQVGIDKTISEVLPQGKAAEIKKLQGQGKKVAMVGDGINDAPALAQADLGIAIGSGTDVAVETGEIVLIKDDLRDVARAIDVSRYTMRKVKQNLFWAFIYNLLGIPIAAGILYPFTGFLLNPAIAALAMAFSSVSVATNSALMKTYRAKI